MSIRPMWLLAVSVLAAFTALSEPSKADTWPERTVRIVTPFSPGVSPDVAARVLADALSKVWKQSVVVENRPGADTTLGTQVFLDARDGHTLLFTTHSTFTVIPLLRAKIPYDSARDVAPISLAVEDFLGVVASPKRELGSLSEFVSQARENPMKFNYYAVPGAPQLAYLAFQKRAGIATTYVAYTNPASAIADLSEGRIDIAVMPLAGVLGAAQTGKIKLLAVTNGERSPAAPHVPTVAEAGFPDFTFGGLLGLFGPKDMPQATRDRIANDVRTIVKAMETEQRLKDVGLVSRGSTPAEFAKVIEEQRAKWSAVARANSIEPQ